MKFKFINNNSDVDFYIDEQIICSFINSSYDNNVITYKGVSGNISYKNNQIIIDFKKYHFNYLLV